MCLHRLLTTDSVRCMTKLIDADEGLAFPPVVEGTGTYGDLTREVDFLATYSAQTGVYEIESLTIKRVNDGEPLNGTQLRSVRVQEAFGEVMRSTAFGLQDGREYKLPYPDKMKLGDDGGLYWEPVPAIPANRKDAQEVIRLHARRLFIIAHAFGQPELRLIQEVLGVSQSTASRLVRPVGAVDEEK